MQALCKAKADLETLTDVRPSKLSDLQGRVGPVSELENA